MSNMTTHIVEPLDFKKKYQVDLQFDPMSLIARPKQS
jgi:hypothetical protein